MRRKASTRTGTSSNSNAKLRGLTVPSLSASLLPWLRVTVLSLSTRLPLRYRYLADVLGHLVAFLHSGAFGDRHIPAFDIGVLIEIDGLPFVARHPRPDRDIGNRVTVRDEFPPGKSAVEHAVEPVRLLEIALLSVGRLARVVFHEMMHLSEHRTGPAHLPHQPFQHPVARFALFRQKLSRLVGEID